MPHQSFFSWKGTNSKAMGIQQMLRWIVIAMVVMVAILLLNELLDVLGFLVKLALPALIGLFILAVVLRVAGMFLGRR